MSRTAPAPRSMPATPRGLHRMAYWEWGDAANPRVLVCVHGLSRQGRDFDTLAQRLCGRLPRGLPRRRRPRPLRLAAPTRRATDPGLRGRHGDAAGAAGRRRRCDWVGTSMGGLIGLGLAQPGRESPVRRLVLNDVGPAIESEALQRIGSYLGPAACTGPTLDAAADACGPSRTASARTRATQWLALTRPHAAPPTAAASSSHYDPAIALALRAITPELAAAGEAHAVGSATTASRCPTLLLRGAESDLLSRATAQAMTRARPARAAARIRRRRPCADAGAARPARRRAGLPARPMKTGCGRPRRRRHGAPSSQPGQRAARRGGDGTAPTRCSAPAPLPSRCSPASCSDTGEDALRARRRRRPRCCAAIGAAPALCAAAYLVYAGDYPAAARRGGRQGLRRLAGQPGRAHAQAGADPARRARRAEPRRRTSQRAQQTERVRKMLLAFSRDLRVVLLRLASRLQTLRCTRRAAQPCPRGAGRPSRMQVFAPLANRLGIWQIKWELEDLAFRFLRARGTTGAVARLLDETRAERERSVERARARAAAARCTRAGIARRGAGPAEAPLQHLEEDAGQGAGVRQRVRRARAARHRRRRRRLLRRAGPRARRLASRCRRVRRLHRAAQAQRLPVAAHRGARRRDGRPVEVQIRTRAMHEHAEHGVAAHWAYKEAGARGYAGVSAAVELRGADRRGAQGRAAPAAGVGARLRRRRAGGTLPAARRHAAATAPSTTASTSSRRRPAIIELPAGATPVDFAYAVHTDLGHRCRGARVDGAMVPLNTPLRSGQTVEIIAAQGGRPVARLAQRRARLSSPARAPRAKVRAWFNAQAAGADHRARPRGGREAAAARRPHGDRARRRWPRSSASRAPTRCSKWSARTSSRCATSRTCCAPPSPRPPTTNAIALRRPRSAGGGARGGVLVVGDRVAADDAGALLPARRRPMRSAAS